MTYEFWIIGGDLRQHWLARQLAQDGNRVHTYGLDSTFLPEQGNIIPEPSLAHCHRGDCVVLPLPMCNNEELITAPFHSCPLPLSKVLPHLHSSQYILGGNISPSAHALALEQQLVFHDYFTGEELTIANAVPTAEGCIQVAMERLPTTIQDTTFALLGFGFVAKATAKRLHALGGNVTVLARNTVQLADAKANGYQTLPLHHLPQEGQQFQCLINTIPSKILQKPQLEALPPSCLIIDLASTPGGVDLVAAEQLQRSIIPALSLPGKVAPATAGAAIKETIYHMLKAME